MFLRSFNEYEDLLSSLKSWLATAEDEVQDASLDQATLLRAEQEMLEPMVDRAHACIQEALKALKVRDEEDQLQFHAQFERRWTDLEDKIISDF